MDVEALTETEERGRDHAWRVHAALDVWTGRVDSKASIVLAVESATFAFVITQSDAGKRLAGLTGAAKVLHGVGFALLLLAIVLALAVVMPQLNRRRTKREWRKNTVFFGHLRHWNAAELARTLNTNESYDEQLARQLVAMSRIAWRKHTWLQLSLIAWVVAAACLVVSAMLR